MLRQMAGRLQSGDPGFDPVQASELIRTAAERLDKAVVRSLVGHHAGAYGHAQKIGNDQALDFALGAGWHAEQIEKGLL